MLKEKCYYQGNINKTGFIKKNKELSINKNKNALTIVVFKKI